jgi:putative DNA primase/helicase
MNRIRDGNTVRNVDASLVNNTLAALRSEVEIEPLVEMPTWVEGVEKNRGIFAQQRELLAFRNGLLDVTNLAAAPLQVEPRSPLWFSRVAFPYDYDPTARAARWLSFLNQVLEGDEERIKLLQEWFGYSLVPDTSHHKFLILEGEGQNGKSVVLDVLTAVLGTENVSNVPLEAFNQRFSLHSTLGRLANISPDVGEIDKVAEGTLKQFISGDRMFIDRKGIPPIEAYPTARLVLATNNLPKFKDRSIGIWRRMLLLPFRYQVTDAERNLNLANELKAEVQGVFNWALEGLRRLRLQGHFTETKVGQAELADYIRESNPAKMFLQDHCEPDPAEHSPVAILYGAYVTWAKQNGYETLSEGQFGKEVGRVYRVQKTRPTIAGHRVYVYLGLRCPRCPSDSDPGRGQES